MQRRPSSRPRPASGSRARTDSGKRAARSPIAIDGSSISVDTYIWLAGDWELTAARTFPRGRELGRAVRA